MMDWKNVKTNSKGQEYVDACELSSGVRSSSRAVFFRNTHATTGEKIVSLKIARYKKSGSILSEKSDKSVTLSAPELDKLIEYIQEYYAPLNIGLIEFIPADKDIARVLSKVHDLGIPDEEVVDKLYEAGILTENLSVAITAAERNRAIAEFKNVIGNNCAESYWQNWFEQNKWVLGSEYLNILPERDIDV